jgi:hypothetical protein
MSRELLIRSAFTKAGLGTSVVSCFHHCTNRAAPPAVCGVAKEVPADRQWMPSKFWQPALVPTNAPAMAATLGAEPPGAMKSGFTRPSIAGPWLLKKLRSSMFEAPTEGR